MKALRDTLIVAAFGAALLFPRQADGGPFQRLKARRAARNATSTTCVGPTCVQRLGTGGPGQLRINPNGGFEGQLPDEYYAEYFTKQTAITPTVQATDQASETSSVTDALQAVDRAESALAEAKAAAERAVIEQRRTAAKEVLEIQQQIEQLRLDFQNQLDDLNSQQKALQAET